jgi:hypothetical protein
MVTLSLRDADREDGDGDWVIWMSHLILDNVNIKRKNTLHIDNHAYKSTSLNSKATLTTLC